MDDTPLEWLWEHAGFGAAVVTAVYSVLFPSWFGTGGGPLFITGLFLLAVASAATVIGFVTGYELFSCQVSTFGAVLLYLLVRAGGEYGTGMLFFYYVLGILLVFKYSVRSAFYFAAAVWVMEFAGRYVSGSGLLDLRIILPLAGLPVAAGLSHFFLREEKLKTERARDELSRLQFGISDLEREDGETSTDGEMITMKADHAERLQEKLDDLVSLVRRVFGARSALIFNIDGEEGTLFIRSASTESSLLDMNAVIEIGKGPVGWVAVKQAPLLTPGRKTPLTELGYYSGPEGIHSFLGVPVEGKGGIEGVLAVDHPEEGAFIGPDERMLRTFADLVSDAVETSRILSFVEAESHELKALYGISKDLSSRIRMEMIKGELLKQFGNIIDFDYGALCLKQGSGNGYRIDRAVGFEPPSGYIDYKSWVDWFLENRGEPLVISGKKGGKRKDMPYICREEPFGVNVNYLVLPLSAGNKVKGAVALVNESRDFPARIVNILSILANHAAVVMENAEMYARMEEMAVTDGLTGLYNHRYFQEAVDEEMKRVKRSGEEMSLVLLDIDNFKSFNDRHGHPAGDAILRKLGDLIRSGIREIDIPARYGGEEFSVILINTDKKGSLKTAERLRAIVEGARFDFEGEDFAVTVSIGVNTYPLSADGKKTLIDGADRALYVSKERGRNCVSHRDDIGETGA